MQIQGDMGRLKIMKAMEFNCVLSYIEFPFEVTHSAVLSLLQKSKEAYILSSYKEE